MKTPRIYLDTSVFGGCFDDEFAKDSLRLIEEIKAGKFSLDCVKMKEECQRAVQEAYGALPLQERQAKMRADIMADPILGPFYQRLTKEKDLKVAETQAKYGTSRD